MTVSVLPALKLRILFESVKIIACITIVNAMQSSDYVKAHHRKMQRQKNNLPLTPVSRRIPSYLDDNEGKDIIIFLK